MRVIQDETIDALYIYFSDERPAGTRQIAEGTLVDLDAEGHLIGIEVICVHRAWPVEEILDTHPVSEGDATRLRQMATID
jgi:uncharacterized protein YuzE